MVKFIEINSKDLDIEEWITSSNELYGYKFKNELDMYLRKVDFKNFPGIFIKMYKDDICIGRCILSITNMIYGFIITEEYRGKGYSKLLLDYIINECNDNKMNLCLDTVNLNMKALAESRGFKLISNGRDDITLTKNYHMVKKIR